MKYYRQILYVLGGILLLAIGMLAFQVYESGVEGRRICKQKAESSLKSTAELWVNQEFEKLGIPYSYGGGQPDEKDTKRRIVVAKGPIIVEVDSVKESRRLFTWMLSGKVQCLFSISTPSIDLLNELWQESLNGMQLHYNAALDLLSEMPGDNEGKRFIAGDSTFIADEYKLGAYYLDDMYFLELMAYIAVPSPWFCADWGENGIVSCLIIVVLCLCALILLFLNNQKKGNEVDSSDYSVLHISKKKYPIGGVLFDEEASTLTFEDKSVEKCSMQLYKLLSAFVHAENHFLSNDRIIEICDWNLGDIGVNVKRRVTISQLRKLLDCKRSHVKIESGKNEQKEFGFYLLVEK